MGGPSEPSTPFIPPLHSAANSPNPEPSPVIPGPGGNTGGGYSSSNAYQFYPPSAGYPQYSPHSAGGTPFIPPSPNAVPSPFIPPTPGSGPALTPGGAPPAAPRAHSRQPSGQDFHAFAPGAPTPGHIPPQHLPPNMSYFGAGMGPYTPYGPMPPPQFSPYGMATPYGVPNVPLSSPYGPAPVSGGLPPHGWGVPNAYTSPISPPAAAQMGGWPGFGHPPPMHRGVTSPQDQWFPANAARRGVEPPPQVHDRMERFTPGSHYHPVLDPFIVKVLNVRITINPLIATMPEDGSNPVHLNWNMLFPTSHVHRSDTPKHLSWSNGREAPATFPRVSSLRLVSEAYPWIIEVRSRDKNYGVTCGEVIDAIGYDMAKLSHGHDYTNLTQRERNEVSATYRANRSRKEGAPGGALGEGMKRLDFLRANVLFGGIEVNDRIVEMKCGDVLPCIFVLQCLRTVRMTEQEIRDNELRARSAARPRETRSRANSNARITVEPPSTTSGSDDEADYDR